MLVTVIGGLKRSATVRFTFFQQLTNDRRVPTRLHQVGFGFFPVRRGPNQRDDPVNIRKCDGQAFQRMGAGQRLFQFKLQLAGYHLATMLNERAENLLQ